ncbi:MAG: DUF3280 domain-containing protein [Hyphomicrobium sp.]
MPGVSVDGSANAELARFCRHRIGTGPSRRCEIGRFKIAEGQPIGECGGCEIGFGKSLGGEVIAWIRVQKISNLILNMNVYMADVATQRMLFLHSVDIRGNTDESWTKSINYLVKNYLLVP